MVKSNRGELGTVEKLSLAAFQRHQARPDRTAPSKVMAESNRYLDVNISYDFAKSVAKFIPGYGYEFFVVL